MRMLPAFLLLLCFHNCRSQTTIASDSGYYASFDSTKIYYETRGQGKAVLLVHGFIVDGSSWERSALLADLVQKGFKVITADLRGNGKSDKPMVETAYAHDAEAKDLIGLMNFLGIETYDVVGYSRGGHHNGPPAGSGQPCQPCRTRWDERGFYQPRLAAAAAFLQGLIRRAGKRVGSHGKKCKGQGPEQKCPGLASKIPAFYFARPAWKCTKTRLGY